MKKMYKIVILCFLLGGLNACASPAEQDSMTAQEAEGAMESMESDEDARMKAYSSVLKDIYNSHMLPGDKDYEYDDLYDISENRFAVYDIDRDGKEELIVEYTTTITAGMVENIYDFDSASNTVREEFSEFPLLKFYDSGVIEAGWSHNQGLAGEFWPYTLYQYDGDADAYQEVARVDAWDRSLAERDANGNLFPVEVDVDGDGIVYYIMTDGEYEHDEAVDFKQYNQWRSSYVKEGEQMDVPFKKLTEENIQKLYSTGSAY